MYDFVTYDLIDFFLENHRWVALQLQIWIRLVIHSKALERAIIRLKTLDIFEQLCKYIQTRGICYYFIKVFKY